MSLTHSPGKKSSLRGAHMTWAHSSLGRTMSRTSMFLRRQLWIWPIIAVIVLSAIGYWVRRSIESTMKESLQSELQTLLNIETAMLDNWFSDQKSVAQSLADTMEIRQLIYQLPGVSSDGKTNSTASTAEIQELLMRAMGPSLREHEYVGFFVTDKSKRVLTSTHPEIIDKVEIKEFDQFLEQAIQGETSVSTPMPGVVALKDTTGRQRTGLPAMHVCAPVRDPDFQVVACLAFTIRPDGEFTTILQRGRRGHSGETYAFDNTGLMVSNSRFDEDLVLLGLLPDQDFTRSILQLQVRDPLGDMTEGYRPEVRRSQLPLTRMAAHAIEGGEGVDTEGYNDYRGVKVVGAWRWMQKYDLGVATEIDYAEAFRPLTILRVTFWGLYALLLLSSIAIFVFTLMVARLRRQAQRAAIEAQQIGQYKLEQKLGSGGMGVVYKGQHAMLRRPTAVKLLHVDRVNEDSIQRFEREVQITSQLNHPNTVAIYDYGRTPEGVFYYAMEFLSGIDLQQLVERYGPQPASRVIRILLQVCGSLYEAHSLGLVHRDIKPSNIMLNHRGSEADVVKVLDFGLVKALDADKRAGITQHASLTGTPLYMSPEAIQLPASVDARSDLYALGAVGYFLLTGHPVFTAANIMELCQQHINATPTPPSQRTSTPIPEDLEAILMSCLEKARSKRPQTARELAQRLMRCADAGIWTVEEAENWWNRFHRGDQPGNGNGGHGNGNGNHGSKPLLSQHNSSHAMTMDVSTGK